MAERTFIAIKPDGVQRGLVGEILGRFERKGFKLVGLKQITPSRALAEQHYGVHKERPFFAGLVDFITSGPVGHGLGRRWCDRQCPKADRCHQASRG